MSDMKAVESLLLRRERLLVNQALKNIPTIKRWWEYVQFYNPLGTNRHGLLPGRKQRVDFIIRNKQGFTYAIEFHPQWGQSGPHKFQLRWLEEKKQFLEKKGIPLLVLRRGESLHGYISRIYLFDRKLKRELVKTGKVISE